MEITRTDSSQAQSREDFLRTSVVVVESKENSILTGLITQAVISGPENTLQEMSAVSQGNDIATIRLPAARPVVLCTSLCTPNARFVMSHTHYSPLQTIRWSLCLHAQLSLSGHASQTTEDHDFCNTATLGIACWWQSGFQSSVCHRLELVTEDLFLNNEMISDCENGYIVLSSIRK